MSRRIQRLSAKAVESKKQPGYYPDGGGLYLQVSRSGTKSWVFSFTLARKQREMGLGPLGTAPHYVVSLAAARAKAADCRNLLANNVDPIAARESRAQLALTAAKSITFREAAKRFIARNRPTWKNPKHISQWENTLATYADPIMGHLPVADVDAALVLRVLEPIWISKHETADRVRQRIERILSWSTVRGYRSGDNPARWRGHLDQTLPTISKEERVKHFPALPYKEIPAFMRQLRAESGIAPLALELTILSAMRTDAVIPARPQEFDLHEAVWTIPAERMKGKRRVAHRVPLSPRALAIARERIVAGGEFMFPGLKEGKPLSNGAMLQLLDRMGHGEITVHGFRSTFKDWATECTAFPEIVSEMVLAHKISNKVEAAYRRGDLIEKRRPLMVAWEKYCKSCPASARAGPLPRKKNG